VPRRGYRIGVPRNGGYREVFNSDSSFYGGSDLGNGGGVQARAEAHLGFAASFEITLPPLAAVILAPA
jgi:1,4-alpha-glucan branching enzyme